jgi:hypothetical protein
MAWNINAPGLTGGVSVFTPKDLASLLPPLPFAVYFKKPSLTPMGEVIEDVIDKNSNLSEEEKRRYKRRLREG